jgi:anti-anti-sigma factor
MSEVSSPLFDQQEVDDIRIIHLSFHTLADGVTLDTLNTDLAAAVSADPAGTWIVDVSQVQICSSALLGVLVNVMNLIRRAKGKLILAGPSPAIFRSIQTCCLHRFFTIAATRAEALDML